MFFCFLKKIKLRKFCDYPIVFCYLCRNFKRLLHNFCYKKRKISLIYTFEFLQAAFKAFLKKEKI